MWLDIANHLHTVYLDSIQAVHESNLRCTWKSPSGELRDTHLGHDWASVEMHLEAVIERIGRFSWRQWLSELRDALQDLQHVSLEMQFVAMIVWSCRLQLNEFEDTVGGYDPARLDEYVKAVDEQQAGCFRLWGNLQPWECGMMTLRLSTHWELADSCQLCREASPKVKPPSVVKISVSNGSCFGPGGSYGSAWQRPYPIKNRRFFKQTITLRPQILIREFSIWYVKYVALHGASFGCLRFSISLNLSNRQPKNLVFPPKMKIISKQLAEF
jgi:hypothetical protein